MAILTIIKSFDGLIVVAQEIHTGHPAIQPARTFPPWEPSGICFASCSLVRIVTRGTTAFTFDFRLGSVVTSKYNLN